MGIIFEILKLFCYFVDFYLKNYIQEIPCFDFLRGAARHPFASMDRVRRPSPPTRNSMHTTIMHAALATSRRRFRAERNQLLRTLMTVGFFLQGSDDRNVCCGG